MPEHEPPPVPPADTPRPIDITIVNRTEDVEKRAQKLSEDKVRERQRGEDITAQGRLKRTKRFFKKAGRTIRYKYGEEYYRLVGIEHARAEMLKHDNPYLHMDPLKRKDIDEAHGREQSSEAAQAKIEQVDLGEQEGVATNIQEAEQANSAVRKLLIDEVVSPIVENKDITEHEVQENLRGFVRRHLRDQNQGVREQMEKFFGKDATNFDREAEFFASNLLAVGASLRNFGTAFDSMKDQIRIKLANTTWAADTEMKRTFADKVLGYGGGAGKMILNETVIGVAVSLGVFASKRGAGSALRAVGAGAGAGFLIGAADRWRNLRIDRASHQTDLEYGMHTPDGAKRREALDKSHYRETASVNELLRSSQERSTAHGDSRSLKDLLEADLSLNHNRYALTKRVAEIQERLRFSAAEGKGYLSYVDQAQVEQGRVELLKGIVEGKRKLLQAYSEDVRADGKSDEEIEREARESMEDLLKKKRTEWQQIFDRDTQVQDREFNRYRVKESLKSGVVGSAIGLAAALPAQEIWANISRLTGHPTGPTILEQGFAEAKSGVVKGYEEIKPATAQAYDAVEGYYVDRFQHEKKVPGDFWEGIKSFFGSGKETPWDRGLRPNGNGQTADALQTVNARRAGYVTSSKESSLAQDAFHATSKRQMRVIGRDGFWHRNADHIHHREWMDYGTPQSDANELDLHTIKHGNGITLRMQHMGVSAAPDADPSSVNVPDVLREGRGAYAFSMAGQRSPLIVMADHAGRLHLDPADHNPHHYVHLSTGKRMQLGDFSRFILNPSAYKHLPNGDIGTEANGLENAFRLGGSHGGSGTISAGRLVEQTINGRKVEVWQSFATIHGTGKAHESIAIHGYGRGSGQAPEASPPPKPNEANLPPKGSRFSPKGGDAATVVVPFTFRKPLERMEQPPAITQPQTVEPAAATAPTSTISVVPPDRGAPAAAAAITHEEEVRRMRMSVIDDFRAFLDNKAPGMPNEEKTDFVKHFDNYLDSKEIQQTGMSIVQATNLGKEFYSFRMETDNDEYESIIPPDEITESVRKAMQDYYLRVQHIGDEDIDSDEDNKVKFKQQLEELSKFATKRKDFIGDLPGEATWKYQALISLDPRKFKRKATEPPATS